jgi:hypothetical protein
MRDRGMMRRSTRPGKAIEDTGMQPIQLPTRGPGDDTRALIPRVQPTPPAPRSAESESQLPDKWPSKGLSPKPKGAKGAKKRQRPLALRLIAVGAVLVTLFATLGLNTVQALQAQEVTSPDGPQAAILYSLVGGDPSASGHAPPGAWSSSAASVNVVVPKTSGEPCHDLITWPKAIDPWMAPPGCYGNIFKPNPANYPDRPGFGWCNWWVRVNHPEHPDITENKSFPSGPVPHAGDAVFFYGGVQGADRAGHWAQVVAVDPDNYWVLISEMNFSWRGAGWARVDYRYIHVGQGVVFIYA